MMTLIASNLLYLALKSRKVLHQIYFRNIKVGCELIKVKFILQENFKIIENLQIL